MIDLKKFNALRAKVQEAQGDVDRARGALDQMLKQLRDEFGCKDLEAADRKAKLLEEQAEAAEEEYNDALQAFEEEWGEVLKELPEED